jgi:hypothetical protein
MSPLSPESPESLPFIHTVHPIMLAEIIAAATMTATSCFGSLMTWNLSDSENYFTAFY